MPPPSTTTFEFVSYDPITNPKPGKSLQVRSRCMQGRNKREGSRRTLRENKRLAKESEAKNHNNQSVSPHATTEKAPRTRVSNSELMGTVIGDLALVRFSGSNINEEARALLFKSFTYNFANQSLSPLDRAVDFDCLESSAFEWMYSDPPFLHSVLCASSAINDFMAPDWDGNPGRKTIFHLRETLSLLQEKLQQQNVHHDESVLQVVMNLAVLAAVFGDWRAAAEHFKGTHRIVQLRGAMGFLKTRPQLHFKLDRIDLVWSLSSGKRPFFLPSQVAWGPTILAPYLPLPVNIYSPSKRWDYRLVNVFQDFQYLSLRINRNALRRARHDPACFHGILTSLQARLMHLKGMLKTPIEELVRLTMLALLTTTFKIPGRRIPYNWVIKQIADVYAEAYDSSLKQDISLNFWILITAAFTVAGTQQVWLRKAWKNTEIGLDWPLVKDHLLRIMWIELIHDAPGKMAFQQLEGTRSL